MYKIQETAESKRYWKLLFNYLIETPNKERASKKLIQGVKQRYLLIAENPELFPFHHNPKLRARNVRKAVLNQYVILYTVDNEAKIVHIHGIFNGRTNYERYFN